MDYYICGIGFVTPDAWGCGRDFGVFDPKPGKLPLITRKDVLPSPYKPFGRMDFFSKIGFSGIYFAVKDAGIEYSAAENADIDGHGHSDVGHGHGLNRINAGEEAGSVIMDMRNTRNTGIIASSAYGCIDTDKRFFDTIKPDHGKNASPALFAYTLPNTFLGEAAIYLGFKGENFIINENNQTGLTALKMGLDFLCSSESDFVVCGLCDTGCSDKYENPCENFAWETGFFPEEKCDYFTGSLFFFISRTEQKFCYGRVLINDNNMPEFNGQIVKSLKELAGICMGCGRTL